MKTKICLLSLLLALSLPARASLYPSGNLPGTTIPDNNSLGTGTTLSYTLSGTDWLITDVSLTFALQGGLSSDLSGYLRLGNTIGSPSYDLTSLIQGQTLNPNTPTPYTIDFTTAGFQTTFNGQNPNNTWTLFFADTVNGDQTTLNGWSLDVTAVPEPANMALGAFGVVLAGWLGLGRFWRKSA